MMIRALVAATERVGVTRERLLGESQIDPALLQDLMARISLDDYRRAVRTAYRLTADPALGLHMGESLATASFDVIGHLIENSQTLRDALHTAVRYSAIVSEGPRIELTERADTATIRLRLPLENTPESRLVSEFSAVALLRILRIFAGDEALPLGVFFTHPRPRHHAEYLRCFGGRALFSQPLVGMKVERTWLDLPPPVRAAELHSYLQRRAEYLLTRNDHAAPAATRVSRWLASQTDLARPTLEQVAHELGTSTRSLRRRLHEEQTQFSTLLDHARVNEAKQLLEDPHQSVQTIAKALGFRTASAFSHAFKRWTGAAPTTFRERPEPRDAAQARNVVEQ